MENIQWIRRGKQKNALAQALTKPMTVTQLTKAMLRRAPKANPDDVRHLLVHFEERGLVKCITPDETKGRVYEMTETGRLLVKTAFGIDVADSPSDIHWKLFSSVARGNVRSMVLLELAELRNTGSKGKMQSAIKKEILLKHGYEKAITMSSINRAFEDLIEMGLIKCVGLAENRARKIYNLTSKGVRIAEELLLLIIVGLVRFPSLLLGIFFKTVVWESAWQHQKSTKPTLRKRYPISRRRSPQN